VRQTLDEDNAVLTASLLLYGVLDRSDNAPSVVRQHSVIQSCTSGHQQISTT